MSDGLDRGIERQMDRGLLGDTFDAVQSGPVAGEVPSRFSKEAAEQRNAWIADELRAGGHSEEEIAALGDPGEALDRGELTYVLPEEVLAAGPNDRERERLARARAKAKGTPVFTITQLAGRKGKPGDGDGFVGMGPGVDYRSEAREF